MKGWRRIIWLAGAALVLVLFARYCVTVVPPGTSPPLSQMPVPGRGEGEERARSAPSIAGAGGLTIPVAGMAASRLVDTYTQARASGARSHDAIDILAPRGTPVLAARAGRVEKLFESERGGTTLYIRSADGRWVDYYAHLDAYAPGLREGQAIARGAVVGTVGSTGNADPDAPHLHFAVNRMAPGEKWYQGVTVNPYPLLMAGR
jgi:murein DD-endopeptidase MepM/ murein hydrolase activator NlpD